MYCVTGSVKTDVIAFLTPYKTPSLQKKHVQETTNACNIVPVA